MRFKDEYKKELDMLCDDNSLPCGEEMLRMIQENAPEERNFEMSITRRKRRTIRFAAAIAACAVISGTTAYAIGHTSIGDLFRNTHNDAVTADIIDEGYFYEIGKSESDKRFSMELLGVTGDWYNPKIAFDVRILDEKIAPKTKKIRVAAKILAEEYLDISEQYADWEAYGVRDEEDPNLYHFDMEGPASMIVNEEKVVMDISYININEKKDFKSDIRFEFTVPMNAYKETPTDYYTGADFSIGKINYNVRYGIYNDYFTDIELIVENGKKYDFDGLDKIGKKHKDKFILKVDGKEYTVNETSIAWGDDITGIWLNFDSVDRAHAKSIILSADGYEIDLLSHIEMSTGISN